MSLYSRILEQLSDVAVDDCLEAILLSFKRELDYSEKDSAWLHYLEVAGVDNWSGIEYAQELYEADEETT
jgi:hypothetical protein